MIEVDAVSADARDDKIRRGSCSGNSDWKLKVAEPAGSGPPEDHFVELAFSVQACSGPTVTADPTLQSVTYGNNVTFTASATGVPNCGSTRSMLRVSG